MLKVVRYLKAAFIVEAVAVPVFLISCLPHWPKTWLGCALVLIGVSPLCFLVEGVSSLAREITPDDSVTAVVYGVVMLLSLAGGYVLFSVLLGGYLRPHFY